MELYEEWFNNKNYWFSKNIEIDIYLANKYFTPIQQVTINDNDNKILFISKIILLDQIPRHYQRAFNINIDLYSYSKKATDFSNTILLKFNNFTIEELCFIYLPYRHIYDIDKICHIINIFITYYNNTNNHNDKILCKKYIYNTLNSSYKYININTYCSYLKPKSWNQINKSILDPESLKTHKHVSNNNLYKIIYEQIINLKNNSVIVISLSGGVDSMVSLFIINLIYKLNIQQIKYIIAVHINYNNNTDSSNELEFVNYYCHYLNIKLIHRTIFEINRNQCLHNGLRDMYENITKKIRFDVYKFAYMFGSNIYVLLGHNKNDCFENIFTNITNKKNYDNLTGMKKLIDIDNITLFRPMLDISKTDIINFANNNNIPYLKDSTPKWSMRGQIRDKIRPQLTDTTINAFFNLAEHCTLNNEIINKIIINNFINKFNKYNYDELFVLTYINIASLFFKKLKIQSTYKANKEFTLYLQKYLITKKERKFILTKDINILIQENNNQYFFIINSGNFIIDDVIF